VCRLLIGRLEIHQIIAGRSGTGPKQTKAHRRDLSGAHLMRQTDGRRPCPIADDRLRAHESHIRTQAKVSEVWKDGSDLTVGELEPARETPAGWECRLRLPAAWPWPELPVREWIARGRLHIPWRRGCFPHVAHSHKTPGHGRGFCSPSGEGVCYIAATKLGTIPAALFCRSCVIRVVISV
jgi:hypothetical protein